VVEAEDLEDGGEGLDEGDPGIRGVAVGVAREEVEERLEHRVAHRPCDEGAAGDQVAAEEQREAGVALDHGRLSTRRGMTWRLVRTGASPRRRVISSTRRSPRIRARRRRAWGS